MDDTFGLGTLSEGSITPMTSRIEFIKILTDHGVVNTICSKNDREPVEEKLKLLGIWDYFVFASIDWTPKGFRISKLIKDMGFRSKNCLFLDDK